MMMRVRKPERLDVCLSGVCRWVGAESFGGNAHCHTFAHDSHILV